MEQTNVVQMPEQKPEREPWERNLDVPIEQQLSDLESRLKLTIYQKERSENANANLNSKLTKIEENWKFIAENIQPFLPDSVDEDRVYEIAESKVDDYITYSSSIVTEDNFRDFFDEYLGEVKITINNVEAKLERK
tara:strand:- start:166 stop:573 length:408 start_codon:yes stop_codon:yes gene_type:complete